MIRTSHGVVVVLLAGAALLASAAPPGLDPVPAAASQHQHAAGLVVDTGTEVKPVCVRFSEDAISGEELLRRADVDPVFADYGSMGKAVCALCGTGCPADDCFCESETSGRYWNYVRAREGGWQSSNRGASNTTLRHGDVDGWAWGTRGTKPPYMTFEAICGTPPGPGDDDGDGDGGGGDSEPSPTSTRNSGGSDDGDDSPRDDGSGTPDATQESPAASQDSDNSGDELTDEGDAAPTESGDDTSPEATTDGTTADRSPTPAATASATDATSGSATPEGSTTPAVALSPDDGDSAAASTARPLVLFTAVLTALSAAIWWRRSSRR